MNTVHRNTVRLLFTALAAGLIALAVVALACGPSGADGLGNGDATPEATTPPTPMATATATPTSTPADQPTPVLLSSVTQTMYRLTERQGHAGASGASEGPQLPAKIQVNVNVRSDLMENFKEFLAANGATQTQQWDVGVISADVPPTLLGPITRHPAFRSAFTTGLYGDKMSTVLDDSLTRYVAGELTAVEAVQEIQGYSFDKYPLHIFYVTVHLESATSYSTVRDFLVDNGGIVSPIDAGESEFFADVPVPAFAGLYSLPEVDLISIRPRPVPEIMPESRAFKQSRLTYGINLRADG